MNTTKILLVFVAEFPWKWYTDFQASLAKELMPHACIPKDAQDEGFSSITGTTVTVLTLHGLDVGAQNIMKEKKTTPVMVHLIFKEFFHKEAMLKFLLSIFPCLSESGIPL